MFCPINNFDAYYSHFKSEIINYLAVWGFLRNIILISYVVFPKSGHFLEHLLKFFPLSIPLSGYAPVFMTRKQTFAWHYNPEIKDASEEGNHLTAYMEKCTWVTHVHTNGLSDLLSRHLNCQEDVFKFNIDKFH